jgi:hypothetical protein
MRKRKLYTISMILEKNGLITIKKKEGLTMGAHKSAILAETFMQ